MRISDWSSDVCSSDLQGKAAVMSTAVAGEIADNNRFDVARLAAYLRYKIPGFGEAIEVKQFQGGQSNPTYLIRTAVGRYVMRKKPAGELLASAHRIDREYRIMAALHGVIPVPRMLHLDRKSTRLNSRP